MSWDWVKQKCEGKKVRGKVVRLLPKGALVELEPGVVGAIWAKELAWSRKPPRPTDVLSHGQEIEVLVLKVDVEREKMELSLRQALGDPWQGVAQKYLVGSVWLGEVVQLMAYGAFVELEPGVEGLVPLSQLAPWEVKRPEDALAIGDDVMVKVLKCDEAQKRIGLSIKAHLLDVARGGGKRYQSLEEVPGAESVEQPLESTVDEGESVGDEEIEATAVEFLSLEEVSAETMERRQSTRVLLVDDEEDVRESSRARLEQAWFEIDVASGGEEAVQQAANNEYAAILMDVRMPDIDGLEATRVLREKGIDAPVVLFTAYNPAIYFAAYRREFPGLSIVNVLQKPLDFVEVAQTIDEIVSGLPVSTPMEMIPESDDVTKRERAVLSVAGTLMERRLGEIAADLQKSTGATALALFHLDPATSEARLIVRSGIALSDFERVKYNLRYSPVKDMIEERGEVFEGNVMREAADRFKNLLSLLPDGFRSCIGLPVKVTDRIEHAFFLFHPQEHFFDWSDLDRTEVAATMMGVEIEKARIRDSLLKSHVFTQRGQMVSSLIHELRNRLMTLSNYADVAAISFDRLEKGQADLADDRLRATLHQAIRGIVTAKERIDDLADAFSEMGKDDAYELLDVNIYVHRVLRFVEPMAQFSGIRLEQILDENLSGVMATGVNLEQILLNLVLNAIQQLILENVAGGVVKVSTACEPQDGELPVKVRVTDNGPGIHKRDFERVFSLGYTTREDGAGLGLFISRKMAEDLRGKITVEASTIFKGTTLLLELPASNTRGTAE
jgi:signal transduction histidine kinase/predicted RNA-binding protein with RPS1 domain/FixJ family two-component response regulator